MFGAGLTNPYCIDEYVTFGWISCPSAEIAVEIIRQSGGDLMLDLTNARYLRNTKEFVELIEIIVASGVLDE